MARHVDHPSIHVRPIGLGKAGPSTCSTDHATESFAALYVDGGTQLVSEGSAYHWKIEG